MNAYYPLVTALRQEIPGFEIRYKNESKLMKFLGFILFFNKHFMTKFTTTLFKKVYFPNRSYVTKNNHRDAYFILRHEAVHLRDAKRFPILFQLTYLLVLPMIFSLRAFWEYRAYKETIRVFYEVEEYITQTLLDNIVKNFTGPNYFFMFPFPKYLHRKLNKFAVTLRNKSL